MKIPKKIRAFGYEWKIVIDKKKDGGEYNWKTKTITLGGKYKDEIEEIFLHEILEATLMNCGYRFYGQEGSMEYTFHFDHSGLVRVHKKLFEILKDNKLI